MQPSKQGKDSVRKGAFKLQDDWGSLCLKDEELEKRNRPDMHTRCMDFVTRSGQSQEYQGEWLNNPSRPSWRRRLMQMILVIISCGKWLFMANNLYLASVTCADQFLKSKQR